MSVQEEGSEEEGKELHKVDVVVELGEVLGAVRSELLILLKHHEKKVQAIQALE